MYIEILGQDYELRFGMGFLKEINKTMSTPIQNMPGVKKDVGLNWYMALLLEGDVEALCYVLKLANKYGDKKLNDVILDNWIMDENTDIDVAFDQVVGFFEKANVSKKAMKVLQEAMAEEKAKID